MASASMASLTLGRRATVRLVSAGNSGVSGSLYLEQASPKGPVLVRGMVRGLKRGAHGFHVHEKGQLGNQCKDAGGHFNPFKVSGFFLHQEKCTTEPTISRALVIMGTRVIQFF